MVSVLKSGVIVCQLLSILLLSILLATPAQKHPIVNTLVVASIARSIVDLLPPLLYVSGLSVEFESLSSASHPSLARFCLADVVLLNYFTIAKAGFAISLTLPCLYLAVKYTRARSFLDAPESTPRLYQWTLIALCVGPFVWALPIVIIVLPKIVHDPFTLNPGFSRTVCTVEDSAAQILALTLILIPLTIAIMVSLLLMSILWKNYRLPDFRHSVELLHPVRIIRFAALVSTTIVSAVIYSIVVATYVQAQANSNEWNACFETWLTVSVIWESVSPLIYFCIFAAQEEVYAIWYAWLRSIQPRMLCRRSTSRQETATHEATQGPVIHPPSRIFAWLSPGSRRAEQALGAHSVSHTSSAYDKGYSAKGRDVLVVPEERHLQDMPRHILHVPFGQLEGDFVSPRTSNPGLSPPPRPRRARSQASRQPSAFRTMPSLTALGNKTKISSRARSSPSEETTAGNVDESVLQSQNSELYSSAGSRPSTPTSFNVTNQIGTFGR